MTFENEVQLLQAEVDAAETLEAPTYEHQWFAWELLRRSPLWSFCAWWQGGAHATGVSEILLQKLFRKIVGTPVREAHKAPIPGDDPVRGYSFPKPLLGGTCPADGVHEQRVLWELLRRFMDLPVTVDVEGTWAVPDRHPRYSGGLIPVVLNLRARTPSIVAAIEALRRVRRVEPPVEGPRSRDVWGTGSYTAADAVALIEHVEAGHGVEQWRTNAQDSRDEVRARVRDTRRKLEYLAWMIENDPLRSLRPPVDPRRLRKT